jgi:uncharacterized membrane protein YkvA (DUF1232 family)
MMVDMNEQQLREAGLAVRPEQIRKVVEESGRIVTKAHSGPLERLLTDIQLLVSMVRDYWQGSYREVPYWALGSTVVALLYVLNPLDLVPDFVPVFGLVDDAAVIGLCLKMVEKDLKNYEDWRIRSAQK